MTARWTIDELGSQAALALATGYDGAPNGRVRDVPDLRTIRYYTTLGLLDRPAEMRGRTGLYGRRHLLQLVAIKRLQARGLPLVEIQRQLVGLTDRALADLAKLPAKTELAPPAAVSKDAAAPAAFWKAAPAAPVPAAEAAAPPVALQGVPLDPAVTLLLAGRRPIEPDDIEAIRVVAAPLLKLLQSRRLIGPHQERDPS